LCLYPNERDAYVSRGKYRLFSSISPVRYSLINPMTDATFSCGPLGAINAIDYSISPQTPLSDLDSRAQDRQGNTILHYAITVVPTGIQLVESIFIGKYEKFDVT
jgi:hypothetical protein